MVPSQLPDPLLWGGVYASLMSTLCMCLTYDPSQLPSFRFHLYADNFQIYFSAWTFPLNSYCILAMPTWMGNMHLRLNTPPRKETHPPSVSLPLPRLITWHGFHVFRLQTMESFLIPLLCLNSHLQSAGKLPGSILK